MDSTSSMTYKRLFRKALVKFRSMGFNMYAAHAWAHAWALKTETKFAEAAAKPIGQ